jgi:hypothetical protein
MVGPNLGGALFAAGGYMLSFAVCAAALVLLGLAVALALSDDATAEERDERPGGQGDWASGAEGERQH